MSNNNENYSETGSTRDVARDLDMIRERIVRRMARPSLNLPEIGTAQSRHTRDSLDMAGRMAPAIGVLNPRPPGLVNDLIQFFKRLFARPLQWVVRPQREFNHAIVRHLNQLEVTNRIMEQNLARILESLQLIQGAHRATYDEIDFQATQVSKEISSLSSDIARELNLQADKIQQHRWAFDGAMARQSTALQERTYQLLSELQDQLLGELRDVRQRLSAHSRVASGGMSVPSETVIVQTSGATTTASGIDYFQLERHFRGSEEEIRQRQSFYLPYFQNRKNVLDIACGRGEFLELMRSAGVPAKGVDIDKDMIGRCLDKGLTAIQSDVFQYLDSLPDQSLDGIFCAQFVEHVESGVLIRLVSKCYDKLTPGGVLAIETPNPECLATMSLNFYCDPTHVRPVPAPLLRVILTEAGLTKASIQYLFPASDTLPVIPQLHSSTMDSDALKVWNESVAKFNEKYFGGMDYAIIAYRPESLVPVPKSL